MASFAEEAAAAPVAEAPAEVTELAQAIEATTLEAAPVEERPTDPRSLAIDEDLSFVRTCIAPAAVVADNRDFITVVIIRTAYARVQLRVQFVDEYPNVPPIVEISSPTLPMPLLRNKEKECMDKAAEHRGKPQFTIIYDHLYKFIQSNMFIPCWKEMKQVATLVEGKGQIGVDEKEGLISIRVGAGNYRQNMRLKVPYTYPEEGVQIEFVASSYPYDIQNMFKSQAEEIVRRCEAGFSPEQAASVTNPANLPPAKGSQSSDRQAKITVSSLKSMKHDVNVLKQMSDLRAATQASDSKKYFKEVNAERREARKDLRRLAKAESEADQEEARRLLEEEQNEMKELLKCKVSETAQPSLFAAAKYLVEDFAVKMPAEPCQACQKPVLPADPDNEALKNGRSERRPLRAFCGHWLHWNCLNDWLTTPPFVRQCPACTRRIWHPDWPEDYKQLEKAWQNKEARKREISDVSLRQIGYAVLLANADDSLSLFSLSLHRFPI